MVDCSASEAAPALYEQWVRKGLHVITPNKKFGAGGSVTGLHLLQTGCGCGCVRGGGR